MLDSLGLVNLRVIERLQLELGPGMTVFVGDNAQGKTSILEGVCLLLRLSSPRARQWRDCVRFGADGLAVRGSVDGRTQRVIWRGARRELEIDGEAVARPADYLRRSALLVWMGSEDLRLVRGPAEGRRRYLDFLGEQLLPGYRAARQGYEAARLRRNRLLKRGQLGAELAAFTGELLRHGEALMALRAELVARLRAPAAAGLRRLGAGADEVLELEYRRGADADFAGHLLRRREAERARGATLVGPHRDEVELRLGGRAAAEFASEGQQRSLALALKLAQGRLLEELDRRPPLWLVDDVFGELDAGRRHALLAEFSATSPGQQLVTTTSLNWMEPGAFQPGAVLEVRAGRV